jgi:hypothetical protein
MNNRANIDFCPDNELGYERSRTRFIPGAGLTLDEAYRLAHLPLAAPDHPRIIAAWRHDVLHGPTCPDVFARAADLW